MALEDASRSQSAELGSEPGAGKEPSDTPFTQHSFEEPGKDTGQDTTDLSPEIPIVEVPSNLDETVRPVVDSIVKKIQSAWTPKLQAAAKAQRDLEAAQTRTAELEDQLAKFQQAPRQQPYGQPAFPGQPQQAGVYPQPTQGGYDTPGQYPAQGSQTNPLIQQALQRMGNPDNLYDVNPADFLGAIDIIAQERAAEAQRPLVEAAWMDREMVQVESLKKNWPAYNDYEDAIEEGATRFPGMPRKALFLGVAGEELCRRAFEAGRRQALQGTVGAEAIPKGQRSTPPTQVEMQTATEKAFPADGAGALSDVAKLYEKVIDASQQS